MKEHARFHATHLLALFVLLSLLGREALADQEDSWNVDLVGHWIGGPCEAVAVRDSIAFASVPAGLIVVDLTDPDAPAELGRIALPRDGGNGPKCDRLVLNGPYAYVACGLSGLYIVDVSNPSAPFVAGFLDTDGSVTDVDVSGGFAYLAAHDAGLRIVDISDPGSPCEVGFVPAATSTYGVTADGNNVYVTELDGGGLRAINVEDPSAPFEVGSYVAGRHGDARGVVVTGDLAYVAYSNLGIRIVDISDPSSLVEVGSLDTRFEAWDVDVSGDHLYVADIGYFLVIDVSDPTSPVELAALRSSGLVYGVAVSGGLVYVTVGENGLRVIDASDASDPQVIGRHATGDFIGRVSVSGDYAYAAGSSDNIRIFDVSDPSAPQLAALYGVGAREIELDGNHAFVISGGDLRVLDISQPLAPVEVGLYQVFYSIYGIAVRNGLAYIANSFDGLRVLDVSDPSSPSQVGYLDTPGQALEVTLSGAYAYVSDGPAGLRVVDISDPTAPFEVGHWLSGDRLLQTAVDGDHGYATLQFDGFVVLDLHDPAAPVQVGLFPVQNSYPKWAFAAGRNVFLAYHWQGLRVFDVSSPENPVEVGYYEPFGAFNCVRVIGNDVYASGGRHGLYILEYPPAVSVQHLDIKPGACPNPLGTRAYENGHGNGNGNGRPPQGVLPVALLGDLDFDVRDVDVSTVRLEGVRPLRHGYLDVSGVPFGEEDCACPEPGPDGYTDFTMKFRRHEIIQAIGEAMGTVHLTLTGNLWDGTAFEATDCVLLVGASAGYQDPPTLPGFRGTND